MNDQQIISSKKQELIRHTTEFCNEYLNNEFRQLAEKLILKMSRKRNVPFLSGKINTWGAATIYALAQINFLFDKDNELCMTPDDICDFFKTTKSTTSQKAKKICDMFKMRLWDSEFGTEEMKAQNPFNNLIEINGIIVDKRALFSDYE